MNQLPGCATDWLTQRMTITNWPQRSKIREQPRACAAAFLVFTSGKLSQADRIYGEGNDGSHSRD